MSDVDVIDRAHAAVERAETRVRTEDRRLAAASRAMEDAAGALDLARRRQEEHEAGRVAGERARDARSAQIAEAVRRAERKLQLTEEAIEDRQAECHVARVALERARGALERKKAEVLKAQAAALEIAPPIQEPELVYGSVIQFVEEYLLPLYRRKTATWCPQWWKHPEVTVRLQALWLSWEQLRQDPALGLSVWLRDHLDHHMPIVLASDGPLKGCKPGEHRGERELLTFDPPPAGLYPDERAGAQ
ncbi:DUF4913 domain-containing protein [Cellulomonas sp. C5510]|uniref:DUF4913 domain-containing protein n=1 Tax=Cellulomonas sp. C5510 TaxID=2871170 RepID=UPI0021056AE8|nr:DUF4913 domain-containing protein [Cellulomonas sp. C5510]